MCIFSRSRVDAPCALLFTVYLYESSISPPPLQRLGLSASAFLNYKDAGSIAGTHDHHPPPRMLREFLRNAERNNRSRAAIIHVRSNGQLEAATVELCAWFPPEILLLLLLSQVAALFSRIIISVHCLAACK